MSSFLSRLKEKKPPYETITKGLIIRDDAVYDTEPRYFTLLLKGFIVYLVVMGSMGCMLSSFKIPYNAMIINIAVFIGALFSSFLYYTKIWENLGYFILFAFMLGTGLLLGRYISSGFFAVVNIISERAAYYFDTEVIQGYAESISNRDITVTIAFIYVGWVFAILLNALISRQMKYFAVMFTSFFFLTIPFYLECEPDMLYIMMLAAGSIIVFVFRGARHTPITKNDNRFEYVSGKRFFNYVYSVGHHIKTVGMLMALVLVFAGVFQIFVNKSDFELEKTRGRSELKQSTHATMANLYKNGLMGLFNRYDSTGGLKSGVLGGVNSVSLDYETDLEVTYVPYSSERLYIRSFTGADYLPYQNRWQRAKKVATYTDTTSKKGVMRVGLNLVNKEEELSSDTARLLKKRFEDGDSGFAKARMDIENIAAPAGAFLPYYVDEEGKNELRFMGFRRIYDLTYYPWVSDPGSVETATEEEKNTEKKNRKSKKKKTAETQAKESKKRTLEETIKKWEDGVYLSVPTENRDAVDQFIKESGLGRYKNTSYTPDGSKTTELINALGEYFQEEIPYTYQPGATPRGTDFVNYFLTDNKKGYCAHFASAATLILRRLGYRARYVEGYAVDPTDLAEDARIRPELDPAKYYQGASALKGDQKVITVDVTDAMAHAWIEVLIDGHWRVAEITPWTDEEAPSGGLLAALIDFLSGTSSSKGSDASSEVGTSSGAFGGLDSLGRILGYGFLILFGAAAVVAVVVFLIRITARRIKYAKAGYSDKLVMDFHRMGKKSKDDAINYRERVRNMEEQGLIDVSFDEQERLISILEKAGFSGGEISEEEYRYAIRRLRKNK